MGKQKKAEQKQGGLRAAVGGFFSDATNKAIGGVHQLGAIGEERNEVYREVLRLKDRAQAILDRNTDDLYHTRQEKVVKAAESFISDLEILLANQKQVYQNILPGHQLLLAENCLDIIFEHQARLEAAPGFWNQLKALVNDCIEFLTGIKNTLSTKGTVFAQDSDFQRSKIKIEKLKDGLEERLDSRSPSP